jgi:hypothetical protein
MHKTSAFTLAMLAGMGLDLNAAVRRAGFRESAYKKCACGRTTTAADGVCPKCRGREKPC